MVDILVDTTADIPVVTGVVMEAAIMAMLLPDAVHAVASEPLILVAG
jgi:hypothetical protein